MGTSLQRFNKELILMGSDSSSVGINVLKVQPPRSGTSKRQARMYCNILCTQLPHHLRQEHSNKYDFALAESLTDKREKKDAWHRLWIAGNFTHKARATLASWSPRHKRRDRVAIMQNMGSYVKGQTCDQRQRPDSKTLLVAFSRRSDTNAPHYL